MNNQDKKMFQEHMEIMFPRMGEYITDSMTPVLGKNVVSNDPVIHMLILGSDVEEFDNNEDVMIETSVYLEENKNKIGKDVVIRLDFFFKNEHPYFETVIYGDLLSVQTQFIEALKKVDTLYIWVANKEREFVKLIELDWDYNCHKDMFNTVLQSE